MDSYAKTFVKVLPATSAAASLLGCGDAALTAIVVVAATAATAESTSSFTTMFDVSLAVGSAASSLPDSSQDLVVLAAASAVVTATVTATFSLTPPLEVTPPTHRQAAPSIPSYSVASDSAAENHMSLPSPGDAPYVTAEGSFKIGVTYSSGEAFIQAAREAARDAGFGLTICRSNLKGKDGRSLRISLQCKMGGRYRNNHHIDQETRKRVPTSFRTGCPFTISALATKDGEWKVQSYLNAHNHDLLALENVICIFENRKITQEQRDFDLRMANVGASTRSIAAAVNADGVMVYTKDIANLRAHDKIAMDDGLNKSVTERLLHHLEMRNYYYRHLLDDKGHIRNLFFTHFESAQQAAVCPEVLIVDATYKTNMFKFPLIDAVDISNIGRGGGASALGTYQLALAWVENEQEATLMWFFQTLKKEIYDKFCTRPEVIITDRDRAAQNAASKM